MAEETQDLTADDVENTNDNFVALRTAHKDATRELKELRAFKDAVTPQLTGYAVKEAGFDPDSPTSKALLKLHEGEMTAEALKETAAQYGLQGTSKASPELTPEQQQAIASSERALQTQASGLPVEPPQTLDQQIREAADKGDLQESLRLKTLKLAQQTR